MSPAESCRNACGACDRNAAKHKAESESFPSFCRDQIALMFWGLGISSFCFGNQDWVAYCCCSLFCTVPLVCLSLYKGFWYLLDVLTCDAALTWCGVRDVKMRISGEVTRNLSFRRLCNEVSNGCVAENAVLGDFLWMPHSLGEDSASRPKFSTSL